VREYAPAVPVAVGRLVARMLAKDPAERGTADELAEEFRRALPRSPAPAPRPAKSGNPKPPPAGAARDPGPRHPLDPVLTLLERIFVPARLRPPPGEELSAGERLAALLRRPAVLALLAVFFVLIVF